MSEVWYANGLRFECTQCGDCCRGEPGFVWVNEAEIAAIAAYLGEPVDQVREYYTRKTEKGRSLREYSDGDCIFWSEKEGCTIYPVRPRQCRTWPFWASNVDSPEAWQQTCRECPGAGKGPLIPAEEIARRIALIRL